MVPATSLIRRLPEQQVMPEKSKRMLIIVLFLLCAAFAYVSVKLVCKCRFAN